jgi:putative membrane protein
VKAFGWLVRILLFFLILSFSLRNTQAVVVEMVPGYVLQAPLIIILLLTFVAGVAVTWLLMLPLFLRYRRLMRAADTTIPSTTDKNNT